MSVDTVFENGTVFIDGILQQAGVAVDRGKIVGIGDERSLPDAREVTDIEGNVVLPGMIDTHVHFREPGFTHKEDFETGTKAAARGGITLVCDMPNVDPPTNTPERFREKKQLVSDKAIVDFGFNASGNNPEHIGDLAEAGAMAIKQFMIADTERSYPHMPGLGIDGLDHLYEIFLESEETGLPLMVHPHSQSIAEYVQEQLWETDGKGYESYMKWYCHEDFLPIVEAVTTLIEFAVATETNTHILHAAWDRGIDLVEAAKASGEANITLETNPHALFLEWDIIKEELGPYGLGQGVPDKHLNATWDAIRSGAVDVIGSDHAPHTREEKEQGWENMWKAPGGTTQVEWYVPLLLDRVNASELTLQRVVDLCSTAPARIFNVYPEKGSMQIGTDADFTIVDMDANQTIRSEEAYTKCGWTPYDGWNMTTDVTRTVVRGETVMRNGDIVGEPGYGEFTRPLAT